MCVAAPMMLRIQGEKAREIERMITPTLMGTRENVIRMLK